MRKARFCRVQSPVGGTGPMVRVGPLAAFLLARFGVELSASGVRRHLHAAGWRWARPRLAPATSAPGGQRKVDPACEWKLARTARALASAAPVLYLDECELQLLP